MQFLKKHYKLIIILLLVIGGITLGLNNWDRYHWSDGIVLSSTDHYRTGAESEGMRPIYFNFCDQGFFRLDNGYMDFYSITHNRTFPLCQKKGCRHEDETCLAWYDVKRPVKGLGTVDGKVYAAFWNEESQLYQLCSLQLDGTARSVIADIPYDCFTDPELDTWFEADFRIGYTPGKAWISAEESSGNCVEYVIDLESGRLTRVDMLAISMAGTWQVLARNDRWILWKLKNYGTKAGTDLYYLYHLDREESDSDKLELLDEEEALWLEGEETLQSSFRFLGEFEDGVICSRISDSPTGAQTVFYWNLESNQKEDLFCIADGEIPPYYEHNVYDNQITANDEIYYCEYERENGSKVNAVNYAFSLMTHRTRELYTAAWDFPYRLEGESGAEWLYGRGGNGSDNLTRIKRSNYENGQFYYKPDYIR